MGKFIANIDRTITITPQPGPWVPGTPTYIQTPGASQDAPNGKSILLNSISWTMAACTLSGGTFVSGGSTSPITAGSLPTCAGQAPLRVDDEGMCTGSFTVLGVPTPCSCKFKITNAGQSKAEAE